MCWQKGNPNMDQIRIAAPEEMGVPSKAIYRFIRKLEQYQIPMHSILMARHGKLIAEGYYAPYQAYTLHRMFSVSKSFTSVAIGLMEEEGKLSLDDQIIRHFPDKLSRQVPPWIAQMTIRDMLKMQTCHTSTTYKLHPENDWIESFFVTEPSHPSGTVFNYDTASSHTLCALVEKLAGKPMLDYLRDRFLSQAGFSSEAYMLKDLGGISMGGSGLMATPKDLLLFALVVMNGGTLNGRQLLPKQYIKEAVSYQTDTLMNGSSLEECQGYGYQFWRIRQNGFACYGMGGQLAICLPEQDFICVTTGDTQGIQGGNQAIYNSLYEEVLPYLSDQALPVDSQEQHLLDRLLKELSIQPLQGMNTSPLISDFHGHFYHLQKNPSGFTSLSLEFKEEKQEGILHIMKEDRHHTLLFGVGRMITGLFPLYTQKCTTSGCWLAEDTFYIKSHLIDECIGSVQFKLVFRNNTVTVFMKKIEETYFNEFNGYLYGTLSAD